MDGAGKEGDGVPQDAPSPADADGEDLPPPCVDPLSFPRTEEGLNDLLTAIDGNCPLAEYVKSDLSYHASKVYIAAGKKLDVPLPPVEQDGSKIEWSVTVDDPYNERLDIDFGLFVIVDGEEVAARDMGRILSPSPDDKDDDETAGSSEHGGEKVSAKGKFTVANSAPVTVVVRLDNSYSWIKPKRISYKFNISSPVDANMMERSTRAKSVVPKIVEGQQAAQKEKEKEAERKETLGRIQKEMEEKMSGLSKQIYDDRAQVESFRKRAVEAEEEAKTRAGEIKEALEAAKKEGQSIEECTAEIIALEKECARLKKKWEELKVERKVREEERQKMEAKAEKSKEERMNLQEEIAGKKEDEKSKLEEIEGVEKERSLMEGNLGDLVKEIGAREAEEQKHGAELKFLQRQFEAVELRFVEPKTS